MLQTTSSLNHKPLFGVYIHWPFCLSKCPYCDFNSMVQDSIDIESFGRAYLAELDHYAEMTKGQTVTSLFFGGGTPSLMSVSLVGQIIERVYKNWDVSKDVEITLEANPTSVEADKFEGFNGAGINRVSLGVQALNNKDLKFLGRQHDVKEALAAVELADKYFDRYSFDLIYARAGQTEKSWEDELKEALKYVGGHLSLYQLTIEEGTAFYTRYKRGEKLIAQNSIAANMYEITNNMMAEAGVPNYEISNYAKPGEESRHNLTYWRYNDYLGIGPGAHGRISKEEGQKLATRAHRAPKIWQEWVEEKGCGSHEFEEISLVEQDEERLLMGLRLKEGIDLSLFKSKNLLDIKSLELMQIQGFVQITEGYLKATDKGRNCLDAVLGRIIGTD